jgi:stearoyl-CoA desaturase (delta-9 desaturase)
MTRQAARFHSIHDPSIRDRRELTRRSADRPTPDGLEEVSHEGLAKAAVILFTVVPFLGVGVAAWHAWNGVLSWPDLIAFAALYAVTVVGITVGYHRLFTHRSFRAPSAVRGALAVMGSMAVEGSVIAWAANHRKHHAFADREGDPHSPHVGHGDGVWGAVRGLVHAHFGWLVTQGQRAARRRFARDLLADRMLRTIDRTFIVWVGVGLSIPFAFGWLVGGTIDAALTALLWGGAVRIFVLHHMTYSINSLCHFFGRRPFATADESRNLAWLAVPTFGESWHNNHHAFPRSAMHGHRYWQLDPGALVIRALERLGLAWDVVRPQEQHRADQGHERRAAEARSARREARAAGFHDEGATEREYEAVVGQ